jgi:hypothetical protein
MRIYHTDKFYFSNFQNRLYTGATRIEVIKKVLDEIKLLSGEFLTL